MGTGKLNVKGWQAERGSVRMASGVTRVLD